MQQRSYVYLKLDGIHLFSSLACQVCLPVLHPSPPTSPLLQHCWHTRPHREHAGAQTAAPRLHTRAMEQASFCPSTRHTTL